MKIFVPPIKSQGIKTKLVLWIKDNLNYINFSRWIEPFMGTGVVGFNIRPKNAIYADINPHIIKFYNSVKNNEINPLLAKSYLEIEGEKLRKYGQSHYNDVRERFNCNFEPLDFLFLNRSCFNGMIRFNGSGKFNVPYGHKPERFSKAYISKIVNQIDYIHKAVKLFNWQFVCQDFRQTLIDVDSSDLIYCDPPYFGRSVDYFNSWSKSDETDLFNLLSNISGKYILSTWHSNKYRINTEIEKYSYNNILTKEHFYHIGASENNRNTITEALIMNYDSPNEQNIIQQYQFNQQMTLLEPEIIYSADSSNND